MDTCHCTVAVGFPEAAAVNVALPGAITFVFAGCAVTAGAKSTVSVAALVVAVPCEFVNTARYSYPFCDAVALAIVSVPVVAPPSAVSLAHVEPLLVDTCHCTVGVGMPFAEAVKDAD